MSKVQLIIGGARSGKSSLAERYAQRSNLPVTYIATAQALDAEMQQRIFQHQADRPKNWALTESPVMLSQAIEAAMANSNSAQGICILVDCLTLWLSNCLCKPSEVHNDPLDGNLDYWQQEKQQLLALLARIEQQNTELGQVVIIMVSNEVGHGIVPMGALSRQFVDQAGWLHQAIAKLANNVEFVMAGLPLSLKSSENVNTEVEA